MTSTQATFSDPWMPSFVRQSISIQIQIAKHARPIRPPNKNRKITPKPPRKPNSIIVILSGAVNRHPRLSRPLQGGQPSLSSVTLTLPHRFPQRRNLLQQFLELHTGQTLQHGRQLADDLCHVAGELAGAAAAVAAVDD